MCTLRTPWAGSTKFPNYDQQLSKVWILIWILKNDSDLSEPNQSRCKILFILFLLTLLFKKQTKIILTFSSKRTIFHIISARTPCFLLSMILMKTPFLVPTTGCRILLFETSITHAASNTKLVCRTKIQKSMQH